MTDDPQIEGIARIVFSRSSEWTPERIGVLLCRLMDCFEDDTEWLSAVSEYAEDKLEDLK